MALAQAQRLYAADFAERDPGDVLMGTVADIDSVVQRLKRQVDGQDYLTAHDLVLLRDWLELAAKWSSVVLSGRLEERQVKLSEAQGQLAATAIRRSLDAILSGLVNAGMSPELRALWGPLVREIVPRELRALA